MMTVLLVIHILIAIALIGMVLAQKSAGGIGMGSGGAGANPFGKARAKSNPMTQMTAYLGAAFFATSLLMALLAKPQDGVSPSTILEESGAVPTFESTPASPTDSDLPSAPLDPVVPTE